MFGVGFTEILVILIVALLVFGPQRLPELARSLGKSLAEFRRASSDLRQSLYEATDPTRLPPERPAAPAAGAAAPAASLGAGANEPEPAAPQASSPTPVAAAAAREQVAAEEGAGAAPEGETGDESDKGA